MLMQAYLLSAIFRPPTPKTGRLEEDPAFSASALELPLGVHWQPPLTQLQKPILVR